MSQEKTPTDAISELCARIRSSNSPLLLPDGATEEEVGEVELSLGVQLPLGYRAFLRYVGYAVWDGWYINGVSRTARFNVIESTKKARGAAHLPPEFQRIPIAGVILAAYAGGGDYFLHDESSEEPGKVSLYLDENAGAEEKSWASFQDFLEDLVLRNTG